MVTPTTNQQRQVQAPNVARGKVFDNSEAIRNSFKNTLQTLKGIENAGNAYLKYQRMQDMADDELRKNQLYTAYSEQMSALNTELSTKRGVQAEEFRQKYQQKASQIHNELLAGLGTIRNHGVREDLRNQINSFNVKNSENSTIFFERAKMEVEEESFNAAQKTLSDNSYELISGSSVDDFIRSGNDIMAQGEMAISKHAFTQGWTAERTRMEADNFRANVIANGARKMATLQDWERGGFVSLQHVFDYIKQNENKITATAANNLYKEYEQKGLSVEVRGVINQIVKPNGTIDYSLIKTKTPHLSYDERLALIDSLVDSNKKGLSAGEAVDQAYLEETAWDQTVTELNNVGLDHLLPQERRVSRLYSADTEASKEFKAEQARIFKEASISDLVSVAMDISAQANTKIVRNPQNGAVVDTTNNDDKLREYQATGYVIENKQQRKDYQVLQSQLWAAVREKTKQGAFGNITGSKWFKGQKPTVEEVVDYNIARQINEMITPTWAERTFQGARTPSIPAASISGMIMSARRAAAETAKINGFLISGEADALTANQKDLVSRAVSIQMAQHTPESMLQYIRDNKRFTPIPSSETSDDFFNVSGYTWKSINRVAGPAGGVFSITESPFGHLGVVAQGIATDTAGSFWNYLGGNKPASINLARTPINYNDSRIKK